MADITLITARDCRRSRKIADYLQQTGIPFTRVDFESAEGQELAAQHDLRASPGIVVDGRPINPFDLLLQPQCRVNEAAADAVFGGPATSGRKHRAESFTLTEDGT